ncbi:hypothetical protein FisN_3Lh055 [Fistulifera solaris]|uniref:Transmembrane protein n=1 Tax=Fistulifera solaris TaxID=1519565 RepID=A0A1Z5JYL6_FISSO|nr:hypothetical protein FisN_3Lh055 [Fistulifera solaris]|eukprot:GAX19117.1 hypothetical protein FisN_3Lh055 [Fistulifera solaris]
MLRLLRSSPTSSSSPQLRHVRTDERITKPSANSDNQHKEDDDSLRSSNILPKYNQSWLCCLCRLCSLGTGNYYDACACSISRPYPNLKKNQYSAMVLLFAAQFLMFVGMGLSWATLLDCQLVFVNATDVDPFLASLYKIPPSLPSSRTIAGLGFFFFQDLVDGSSCVLEEDINATQTGEAGFIWINSYMEFLGPAWYSLRRVQSGAQTLAFILCIWVGTYCCLSHTQRLRYLWCFANLAVLCPLQISSLFIVTTGFCQTYSCTIGRTYGFSIASLICFFVAALIVLVKTRNYFPGIERIARPDNPIFEDESPEQDAVANDHGNDIVERGEGRSTWRKSDGLGDAIEVPISKDMLDMILSSPEHRGQCIDTAAFQKRNYHSTLLSCNHI